jgi:hypothetical protein
MNVCKTIPRFSRKFGLFGNNALISNPTARFVFGGAIISFLGSEIFYHARDPSTEHHHTAPQ